MQNSSEKETDVTKSIKKLLDAAKPIKFTKSEKLVKALNDFLGLRLAKHLYYLQNTRL